MNLSSGGQGRDDPETEALLERLANDPVAQALDRKVTELLGHEEYSVCVIDEHGSRFEAVPIFARPDTVFATFDSIIMQWHFDRQLYPTALFAGTRCENATALVLVNPDGIDIAIVRLTPESSQR